MTGKNSYMFSTGTVFSATFDPQLVELMNAGCMDMEG
jgi:hypothetical protein